MAKLFGASCKLFSAVYASHNRVAIRGNEENDASGAVVTSIDGGRTWGPAVDIDNGQYQLDAETDVIALKDGSLLAALRGDGNAPMCWSKSLDGGKTWSVAQSLGFLGHCTYLHRTPENVILLAHRQPATSLHYSVDEGQTWSDNVPVDTVGAAYPSMVTLKDGSVLSCTMRKGRDRRSGREGFGLPPSVSSGCRSSDPPVGRSDARRLWHRQLELLALAVA